MNDWLTEDEIRGLTARERRPAQVKQLNAMGVEFRQRADRSIVVMRAHVERLFGATPPAATVKPRKGFVIKQPGA